MAIREMPPIDVYEPSGAINAKRLARTLGFTLSQIARSIDKAPSTLNRNPAAPSAQDELAALAGVFIRIVRLFSGNVVNARIWLHAPHSELGYRRPMDYLLERRRRIVDSLLGAIEEGMPG